MQLKKSVLVLCFVFFSTIFFNNTANAHYKLDKGDSRSIAFESHLDQLYTSIKYTKTRPDFDLFRKAFIGYLNLKSQNKLSSQPILTIIDFRLPSRQNRLWIIDLDKKKIVHESVVSHGKNSGNDFATNFSNVNESNMSSYGFYVTGSTYIGKHGHSLYLDGQDAGYNCNARKRAIVMHSAEYANPGIVKSLGRLGRSLGCPAIPEANHKEIINKIDNKTCLFIYYPDAAYEKKSKYLSVENAMKQLFLTQPLEDVVAGV